MSAHQLKEVFAGMVCVRTFQVIFAVSARLVTRILEMMKQSVRVSMILFLCVDKCVCVWGGFF